MIAIDNKRFIQDYWKAIDGKAKTPELLAKYMDDTKLIGHIMAFEKAFPCYELIAEDYICEDDKVVVRARVKGVHKGELMGMPPTGKNIDSNFTVIYQIANDKIVKSWLTVDGFGMMGQLGMMPSAN